MRRRGDGQEIHQDAAEQEAAEQPHAGIVIGKGWIVSFIAILIILVGIPSAYVAVLHNDRLDSEGIINQLTAGQINLREERDRSAARTSELETALENSERRLAESQKREATLQAEVQARLKKPPTTTKDGQRERASQKLANDALKQKVDEKDAQIAKLQTKTFRFQGRLRELAQAFAENQANKNAKDSEAIQVSTQRTNEINTLRKKLASVLRLARMQHVVQNHIASLGHASPYYEKIGSDAWDTSGEIFTSDTELLDIPDLSDLRWKYDGARIIGAIDVDALPMVMLRYTQDDADPVSLTIAVDSSGDRAVSEQVEAGFNVLDWQDERGEVFLVGPNKLKVNAIAAALTRTGNDEEVSAVDQQEPPTIVRSSPGLPR